MVVARDLLAPVRLVRCRLRRADQAEVLVAVVGEDPQAVMGVVDAVAVAVATRGDHLQGPGRCRGIQETDLAGDVGTGGDHQKAAAARLADPDEEGRIVLLVDHGVAAGILAQAVGAHPVGAQAVVELDIEQGPAVLRPLDGTRGVDDEVGELVAVVEVAQVQAVAFRAVLVGGVGEQAAVGAHVQRTQVEVGLARGQGRLVEQDRGLGGVERAAVPGAVLRTREVLPVILEPALAHRYGAVVGLDARLQLGMQPLDPRPQRRHELLEPGVLGLEIAPDRGIGDLGVGRVAQPAIVVVPAQAETLVPGRQGRCPRWCLQRHRSIGVLVPGTSRAG